MYSYKLDVRGCLHEWSQVTRLVLREGCWWVERYISDTVEPRWTDIPQRQTSMDNSKKSRLFFHSLQYLSNPWISDTPLLCITDSFHGTNCTQTVLVPQPSTLIFLIGTQNLASFPGLPCFCSSVCYIERKTKKKQGRPGNEATKLKCSNSERYFNWLTASRCPCSHSQAPTPTFCYL